MASSVLTSSVSSQGFHFTLSTTVSNTHQQNADNCSLHILYELDPHVYADQYELAQRPGYSLLLWGTSDLEKPVSAVDPSGSVLLLTAHSYSLLQNGDTNVTIDLPLHARYPNPSTAAETPYHHISLQRPVGFFACSKGRSSVSLVPDALRTFTSLQGWPLVSRALSLIPDQSTQETFQVVVPTGRLDDLAWVDMGTAVVMIAMFFYLSFASIRTAQRLARKPIAKTE